jgi:hypothetical protein
MVTRRMCTSPKSDQRDDRGCLIVTSSAPSDTNIYFLDVIQLYIHTAHGVSKYHLITPQTIARGILRRVRSCIPENSIMNLWQHEQIPIVVKVHSLRRADGL